MNAKKNTAVAILLCVVAHLAEADCVAMPNVNPTDIKGSIKASANLLSKLVSGFSLGGEMEYANNTLLTGKTDQKDASTLLLQVSALATLCKSIFNDTELRTGTQQRAEFIKGYLQITGVVVPDPIKVSPENELTSASAVPTTALFVPQLDAPHNNRVIVETSG